MTVLEVALWWYNRGFLPIPMVWQTKRPLVKWSKYLKPGAARPGVVIIERWFGRPWKVSPGGVNLALVCGVGDLVCLDFDSEPLYWHFKVECSELRTRTTKTPRPGYHVWLKVGSVDPDLTGVEGLEVKSRSTVNDWPGVHPSGAHYEPVEMCEVAAVKDLGFLADVGLVQSWRAGVETTTPTIHSPDGWVVFDDVRRSVDFAALLGPFAPVSSGEGYIVCRCPFHDDHRRSFWANLDDKVCGCFRGDCTAHRAMDVIAFYAKLHDLGYRVAALALGEVSDASMGR